MKAAREATFSLFFAEIPAIAQRNGVAWPQALEAAVRTYLYKAGLQLPSAKG